MSGVTFIRKCCYHFIMGYTAVDIEEDEGVMLTIYFLNVTHISYVDMQLLRQ